MADPMKHGSFSWNELATTDVAKAGEFYTKLLGWTTREIDMGDGNKYTVFSSGKDDVGGMMAMGHDGGDIPPHWMNYITVDDVDACAAKVEGLGGKVCVPPTDIPQIGRFCVVTDPTGANISLIKYVPMEQ